MTTKDLTLVLLEKLAIFWDYNKRVQEVMPDFFWETVEIEKYIFGIEDLLSLCNVPPSSEDWIPVGDPDFFNQDYLSDIIYDILDNSDMTPEERAKECIQSMENEGYPVP